MGFSGRYVFVSYGKESLMGLLWQKTLVFFYQKRLNHSGKQIEPEKCEHLAK